MPGPVILPPPIIVNLIGAPTRPLPSEEAGLPACTASRFAAEAADGATRAPAISARGMSHLMVTPRSPLFDLIE